MKSGLANDVQDCAEIYWIVENAGGMGDADLARFRDRLKLTHIASVDSDDGGAATPYTQEVPYAARKEVLSQLKADIYEDFGALDVHTVAAGATNDHIDAAYQPMDEEADEFERHIREGIMDLLALQGIEDTPIFTRNRISNLKEQVEVVAMEAEWLDEETVLRKLPNVTPDEVAEILARKDAEAADRMASMPPSMAQVGGAGDEGGVALSEAKDLAEESTARSLNGAQTASLLTVLSAVSSGQMSENQGAKVLSVAIGGMTYEDALKVIRGER